MPPEHDPAAPPSARPLGRLAARLGLFGFASTFLTAAVLSLLALHATYGFMRRGFHTRLPAFLSAAEERLTPWLDERAAELAWFGRRLEATCAAGRPAVCSWSALGVGTVIERQLAQELARSQGFEGLALVGPQGTLLASVGRGLETTTDVPGSLSQTMEPPSSPAELASEAGRGLISQTLAGGARLLGWLDPAALGSLLDPPGLPQGAALYLLDGRGHVLAASGDAEPTARPGARALARSPFGRALEYENDSGVAVVGSRRPLEISGWQLLLEQPRSAAYAPLASAARRVLLADLFVIALFSFVARRITRAILDPIHDLSEGARRISRGEIEVQIPGERDDEIGLLVRAFNEMSRAVLGARREIEEANDRLQLRNLELQAANEALEQLSITDGLTKLHNHRFFQDTLTREIKRAARLGEPLSMLLIDIDDFKRLNDRLGHAAGDQLLAAIARLLNDSVRESDLVARYGGEEFVVIASSTPLDGALHLAEKTRRAVAEASFILDDSMRIEKVTVSVGVAQYRGDRKAFFRGADQALYRAKAEGKNRVVAEQVAHVESADALSA